MRKADSTDVDPGDKLIVWRLKVALDVEVLHVGLVDLAHSLGVGGYGVDQPLHAFQRRGVVVEVGRPVLRRSLSTGGCRRATVALAKTIWVARTRAPDLATASRKPSRVACTGIDDVGIVLVSFVCIDPSFDDVRVDSVLLLLRSR